MKTKKILLSGLAGGVASFFLGWLIYGILLEDFMLANFNQCANLPMEQMNWIALILSNLLWGFVISIIINWSGAKNMVDGLTTGALIGFLLSLSLNLGYYSMTTMFNSITALFMDVFANTVMSAIVGALAGFILNTGNDELVSE